MNCITSKYRNINSREINYLSATESTLYECVVQDCTVSELVVRDLAMCAHKEALERPFKRIGVASQA